MSRTTTLRVHWLEHGRIIPEISSRATMAVTLGGHSMTVDAAGDLAEWLQLARTA